MSHGVDPFYASVMEEELSAYAQAGLTGDSFDDGAFEIEAPDEEDALIRGLTESQREAITAPDGPLLVLAGAGTGKTRVLTTRIAKRLTQGDVLPAHVLALTFTRKAAQEMRHRLETLVGPVARFMDIGTFHGIFAKAMRDLGGIANIPQSFTLLDDTDQGAMLRDVIGQRDDGKEIRDKFKTDDLLSDFSRYKMAQLPGQEPFQPESGFHDIENLLLAYEQAKRDDAVLDYDDVLFLFEEALRDPRIAQMYARRWRFVLVDEYQDTNAIQEQILVHIAGRHKTITCVGDDDQSIYSFRQADVRNILSFQERWTGAKIVRLEHNFRSSGEILRVANGLISVNTLRHGKTLEATNPPGEKVRVNGFETPFKEADDIYAKITRFLSKGSPRSEIAVIARNASVLQNIERKLLENRIPYTLTAGKKISDRVETKVVAAFIRMAINEADETAFVYAFTSKNRKIGNTVFTRMREHARRSGMTIEAVVRQYAQSGGDTNKKGEITAAAAERAANAAAFIAQIDSIRSMAKLGSTPLEITEHILDVSGIIDTIIEDRDKGKAHETADVRDKADKTFQSRMENLNSLKVVAAEVDTIEDMAANIVLSADRDEAGQDAVWLGTIHAAKGLEFDHVFLPGFENNILPSPRADQDQSTFSYQEERNLAYVAITRARKTVDISYAMTRMTFGEVKEGGPSAFVADLRP